MVALTDHRDTVQIGLGAIPSMIGLPVAAGETIYQGGMVGLDANGRAEAATTTSVKIVGRAKNTVDNSAGGDGDLNVEVEFGVFRYANDGTNPVTLASRLTASAHVLDDQTVDDGTGTGTEAGITWDVGANHVDVLFLPFTESL